MPIFEEWKVIKDYPSYEVSNMGEIRNKAKRNVLAKRLDKRTGYLFVRLYAPYSSKQKLKLVHRLVANAYIPNIHNYPCVNHKDENKQNNCSSNLEWVTYKQNNNYGTRNKRISKRNKGNHQGLLRAVKIVAIDKNGSRTHFKSLTECAKELGLYRSSISLVLHGKMRTTGGYRFERE